MESSEITEGDEQVGYPYLIHLRLKADYLDEDLKKGGLLNNPEKIKKTSEFLSYFGTLKNNLIFHENYFDVFNTR